MKFIFVRRPTLNNVITKLTVSTVTAEMILMIGVIIVNVLWPEFAIFIVIELIIMLASYQELVILIVTEFVIMFYVHANTQLRR